MISDYFRIDNNPKKGLMAVEWVVLAYIAVTLLIMQFTSTKIVNPHAMLWLRIRSVVLIAAMWLVYRLIPCRFVLLLRVLVQMMSLAVWYPDTYELNRMFDNKDYLLAEWEQQLFGCQPALLFSKAMPWHWFSELLDMGYFSYYPMIGLAAFFYMIFRYGEFERASFVIMASFFIYYVIFIFFPTVGPTFYYNAVGTSDIAKGVFPHLGDYFSQHTDCLPAPGWQKGVFYNLVEDAKAAGERPTAAFPSSHVGVSTIIMLLVWHTRNNKLLLVMLPFYIFLCLATVYIQAHYLIDAIAGFFSGILLYAVLMMLSRGMVPHEGRQLATAARKRRMGK